MFSQVKYPLECRYCALVVGEDKFTEKSLQGEKILFFLVCLIGTICPAGKDVSEGTYSLMMEIEEKVSIHLLLEFYINLESVESARLDFEYVLLLATSQYYRQLTLPLACSQECLLPSDLSFKSIIFKISLQVSSSKSNTPPL